MSGALGVIKLGGGLAGIVAVAGWLGVAPALREAQAVRDKIAAAEHSLDRSESKAQDVRTLADTLSEARRFAQIHTKPIVDRDISALMQDIGAFLTTLSVTSHEMKQDRAVERNGVRITPVNLTMRASFLDLDRLIEHIENGDRLVRIARVRADVPRAGEPGAGVLLIEVDFESIAPLDEPRSTVAGVDEESAP